MAAELTLIIKGHYENVELLLAGFKLAQRIFRGFLHLDPGVTPGSDIVETGARSERQLLPGFSSFWFTTFLFTISCTIFFIIFL